MKTYTNKKRLEASAENVMKLLATPEQLEDEAKVEGSISAKARVEKSDDSHIVIIVERQDPGRTPTGRDPKKTEKTILTVDWDLKALKCKWHVRVVGPQEKLARIEGVTRLEADGPNACHYVQDGSVDIKLPLVGNLVAGVIVNDIKRDFPKKMEMLGKKIAKL